MSFPTTLALDRVLSRLGIKGGQRPDIENRILPVYELGSASSQTSGPMLERRGMVGATVTGAVGEVLFAGLVPGPDARGGIVVESVAWEVNGVPGGARTHYSQVLEADIVGGSVFSAMEVGSADDILSTTALRSGVLTAGLPGAGRTKDLPFLQEFSTRLEARVPRGQMLMWFLEALGAGGGSLFTHWTFRELGQPPGPS